jgi:hypothetical protein
MGKTQFWASAMLLLLAFFFAGNDADAQSLFGKNLIVNGNADAGGATENAGSIQGWANPTGTPRVRAYATTEHQEPGVPTDHGPNYFNGGSADTSSLTQTIDLTPAGQAIDTGGVTFDASAYIGGAGSDDDTAQMKVAFKGQDGGELSSVTVGPVTPADRDKRTSTLFRRQIGPVPAKTRTAVVTLLMTKTHGSTQTGTADDLSLILVEPPAPESLLGKNLVVDGDAEAVPMAKTRPTSDVPGWCNDSYFAIDYYGDDQKPTSPGPKDRGKNYFYGGESQRASAWQDIYVEPATRLIDDKNEVDYALSGWLGGIERQNDSAVVTAEFRDWSGKALGSAQIGPVTAAQRKATTMLVQQSKSGALPAGTRYIRVTITSTRTDGSTNDGEVDNVALVLNRRPRPAGKQ